MKKKVVATFAILALAVFSFSQVPVSTNDSLKISSQSQSVNLGKKTIVTPKPPTNWSKIKDLFR